MKGFDAHTASLAGAKSAQTRRTRKVYREQHRAAMIDKAEQLVTDFMDGKAVLGITLSPETRAAIIEHVLTEVTTQSLIGALKHRDEVDLMMLKHELTINPDAGNTIDGTTSCSDEKPVMLTNTELMTMLGTRYETETSNAKPEEDDELFFDWYKSQSGTHQKSILQKYFNNDEEELMNFAGRPAASVIKQLRINNG